MSATSHIGCSQLMLWFVLYQLQLVYLTVEHCPARNLQQETLQITFDTFNQSQHFLHTLRKSFVRFSWVFTFLEVMKCNCAAWGLATCRCDTWPKHLFWRKQVFINSFQFGGSWEHFCSQPFSPTRPRTSFASQNITNQNHTQKFPISLSVLFDLKLALRAEYLHPLHCALVGFRCHLLAAALSLSDSGALLSGSMSQSRTHVPCCIGS